jgi:membrane associated rhomboid family serine protease
VSSNTSLRAEEDVVWPQGGIGYGRSQRIAEEDNVLTDAPTVHRLNTYPFIHLNWFHTLMNIIALTPLLERFERESGTLTALALFLGPLSTLPAGLYLFFEKIIFRGNTPVMGARYLTIPLSPQYHAVH